jgi:hypothetical protein
MRKGGRGDCACIEILSKKSTAMKPFLENRMCDVTTGEGASKWHDC